MHPSRPILQILNDAAQLVLTLILIRAAWSMLAIFDWTGAAR
jgi:hypothetical protein